MRYVTRTTADGLPYMTTDETSEEVAARTGESLYYVTFLCRGEEVEGWREQVGNGESSIVKHAPDSRD